MHVFTALFTAQFLVTNTASFELGTTKTSQADLKSAVLTSKSIICDEAHVSSDIKSYPQRAGLPLHALCMQAAPAQLIFFDLSTAPLRSA